MCGPLRSSGLSAAKLPPNTLESSANLFLSSRSFFFFPFLSFFLSLYVKLVVRTSIKDALFGNVFIPVTRWLHARLYTRVPRSVNDLGRA